MIGGRLEYDWEAGREMIMGSPVHRFVPGRRKGESSESERKK